MATTTGHVHACDNVVPLTAVVDGQGDHLIGRVRLRAILGPHTHTHKTIDGTGFKIIAYAIH